MSETQTTAQQSAVVHCPAYSNPEPCQFIAFDLAPLRQLHPTQTAVIDRLCQGANPPYTWGILSTAAILQKHYQGTTVEEQFASNIWSFVGETCEQRDHRVIEDFRLEMIKNAGAFGASDELVQALSQLTSAYYLITYVKGSPATKCLKAAA